MASDVPSWQEAQESANLENPWFIPAFISLASESIYQNFLKPELLDGLTEYYQIPSGNESPKNIGIVMAGNIPLVGFHDLMCVFISGQSARIKPSSKDQALIKHIVTMMIAWDKRSAQYFSISERIPDCQAYIATGSNNSARYFEYYFNKYPSIIRKNRTSVAVLNGSESEEEREKLANDIFQYFGLGCRNVTKIYVPEHYEFIPLLRSFKKYDYLADHNKYRNNYDYNLAVHIINNQYYMSSPALILVEEKSFFSRISQLNYELYKEELPLLEGLRKDEQIQCVVGRMDTAFGKTQHPGIFDFADGMDTIQFLKSL